jgi:hypothetical protein
MLAQIFQNRIVDFGPLAITPPQVMLENVVG